MRIVGMLLAFGLLFSGCISDWNRDDHVIIGCLGDSNTDEYVRPITAPTWCSKLTQNRGWLSVNYAISGAPIVAIPGDGTDVLVQLHQLLSAGWQPDVLIVAAGSNDIIRWDSMSSPEKIVATLKQLDLEAAAAGIHDRWYALIPPVDPSLPNTGPINEIIRTVNETIRAGMGEQVIDLNTGFDNPAFFQDIVHFNQMGQAARATAVFEKIVQ